MEVEHKHWLHNCLTPSVTLVESLDSESYENACLQLDAASGGSLLRLLDSRRGSKRAIEYLTPSTKMSQLFKVRFCASTEFTVAKDSRSIDNTLFQSVASQKPEKKRVEPPYPWFILFRRTLMQTTNTWKEISDETGSTLYLPLVVLFAISASEQDPVARLAQMLDKESYPPYVPKAYVIVATPDTTEQELEIVQKLVKAGFGSEAVSLLNLKSEKSFEETFHELMTRVVMITQKRIFSLNEVVSSQKRGLTNTFRSLFGGTGASANAPSARGLSLKELKNYPPETVQFKTRTLADLLFWMRDYEAALVNYSFVRDDYQRDEAFLHMGTAFEMIALCSFLSRGPPSSFEEGSRRVELVDRALDCYFKAVPADSKVAQLHQTSGGSANSQQKRTALGYRLATRASLMLLDIAPRNTFSNLKVIMKALAHEDELCAAVLLEQIAVLMLDTGVARRGMRRKSGFNLLHAASLYRSLGLDHHAFRCYAAVHEAFYRRGWPAAEHHLEVNLGNLARNLNDLKSLVEYRGCCLERGYEVYNTNQHSVMLREFCDAIDKLPAGKPLKFELPRVCEILAPRFESELDLDIDERTLSDVWNVIESSLLSATKSRKRRSTKNEGYIQEPLFMDITVENPLNCELRIHQLSLLPFPENKEDAIYHVVDHVVLQAKEKRTLRASFTPTRECTLKVRGLSWKLTESARVDCEHEFRNEIYTVEVGAKAPCLKPTIVPIPSGSNESNAFTVSLKNVGALEVKAGSRFVIAMAEVAALEWWWEGGSKDDAEVIDDQGLVISLPPLMQDVHPGESVSLECRFGKCIKPPYRALIMYNGTRISKISLPKVASSVIDSKPILAKGHCVITSANKYLLVIDVESAYDHRIKPLGISCYSRSWKVQNLVSSALPPIYDSKWSLVLVLERMDSPSCSFVSFTNDYTSSKFGLLNSQNYNLRCHHAHQVFQEKLDLKKRLEKERAELEAKGQLPVTIQDVRRARQRGELLANTIDAITAFAPGSSESIDENREMVHLMLDFVSQIDANHVQNVYMPRVPICPPLLDVRYSGFFPKQIRMQPGQQLCEIDATISIQNNAESETVRDVRMVVGQVSGSSADQFSKPSFWVGPTTKIWTQLEAGQTVSVQLKAMFSNGGVFSLGPVIVECKTSSNQTLRIQLREEPIIAIVRDHIDDDKIFAEVERELRNA